MFCADNTQVRAAILGFCCGLDMTRRDLQLDARCKRRPWDLGKDFASSAVFGPITRAGSFAPIGDQRIQLAVNGQTRQDARLSELVWNIEEILVHLSRYYHLDAGDPIMTGTPAGVGPVAAGDHIVGGIDGLEPVSVMIGAPLMTGASNLGKPVTAPQAP